MRICYTTPTLTGRHGGVRVLLEHVNRLTDLGHQLLLLTDKDRHCDWFNIDKRVSIVRQLPQCDVLVICSPHHIHLQNSPFAKKKFIFCQMLEHMFRAYERTWFDKCIKFYLTPHPLIAISKWNIDFINKLGRTGKTFYIGNGVNLNDFHVSNKPKDGKTVLVEAWECNNGAKDIDYIAPKVAAKLRNEGYYILAYSALPLKTYSDVPHEYYYKPSLEKINELYERATILIKASRYDARSCSPVEAYVKGTVTARAIIEGDDDLINEVNCLKCGYNAEDLYKNAKRLLTDPELRQRLATAGMQLDWNYWIGEINKILTA